MRKTKSLYQHTLSLLGHPVVNVELDEGHMKTALSEANSNFELYSMGVPNDKKAIIKDKWVEQSMKSILGRVRGKYSPVPIPDGYTETDASKLSREAEIEIMNLLGILEDLKPQLEFQS